MDVNHNVPLKEHLIHFPNITIMIDHDFTERYFEIS